MKTPILKPGEIAHNPTALTQPQAQIVALWTQGYGDEAAIAKAVGYANAASVRTFLRSDRGRQAVLEAVKSDRDMFAPRALATLQALANKAKNERVRLDAALAILEALGILGDKATQDQQQLERPADAATRPVSVTINIGPHADAQASHVTLDGKAEEV